MNAIKIMGVLLIASACSTRSVPQQYAPQGAASFQLFYDELSPYGAWINYPPYGYVWIPDVGFGFSPYVTSGHWVYTRYGWTWHSYYRWGWAPFHYGRWYFDPFYGWVWIPDTYWAPAWVVWRIGGGYCGWAPLGPNITISVAFSGAHNIPQEHWVFVQDKHFTNRNIDRYRLDNESNKIFVERAGLLQQTREHQNVVYAPGPDRVDVQKFTGKPVTQRDVNETNKPGRSKISTNSVDLFKPRVKPEAEQTPKSVPKRVFEQPDIRQHSDRPSYRKSAGGTNMIYKNPAPAPPAKRPSEGGTKPGKRRGN
jgi:hypothetical protein